MAQWAWQFSGLSHATKVDDSEIMLAHAVEVLKASSENDRPKKAKSVRKLAGKVLSARLKIVKAKCNDAEPVKSEDWAKTRKQVAKLQELETTLASGGVAGILREFGVPELAETNE